MDTNEEGILWVKLRQLKYPTPSTTGPSLINIRWTKRSRAHLSRGRTSQSTRSVQNKPPNQNAHCGAPVDPDSANFAHSPIATRRDNPTRSISHLGLDSLHSLDLSISTLRLSEAADEEEGMCVVCLERAADFQLLPCRHDRFCRQCIIETICTWSRLDAPCCPLCRSTFHTMVLLD